MKKIILLLGVFSFILLVSSCGSSKHGAKCDAYSNLKVKTTSDLTQK
jgi:hypothetical protein